MKNLDFWHIWWSLCHKHKCTASTLLEMHEINLLCYDTLNRSLFLYIVKNKQKSMKGNYNIHGYKIPKYQGHRSKDFEFLYTATMKVLFFNFPKHLSSPPWIHKNSTFYTCTSVNVHKNTWYYDKNKTLCKVNKNRVLFFFFFLDIH